jgi:hypothetical protein
MGIALTYSPISKYMGTPEIMDNPMLFDLKQTDNVLTKGFDLKYFYKYIYLLSDPIQSEPKYVGKATILARRYNDHLNYDDGTKKACWIKSLKKLGVSPVIEQIDRIPNREWRFWEMHYISLFRSWGFDLKNDTEGGDGTSDADLIKLSEYAIEQWNSMPDDKKKDKLRQLKEGRTKARENEEYSKLRFIIASKAAKKSYNENPERLEFAAKNASTQWDNLTVEQKKSKVEKLKSGRKKAKIEREIKGLPDPRVGKNAKQILLFYKKTGELFGEYKSSREVSSVINISTYHIRDCALGRKKSAGGYICIYKNDFTEELLIKRVLDAKTINK